jgi:hypothetical protein
MRPSGSPEPVSTHDFPDAALGKVIPYGIYDLAADTGWVNVGCDHDDQLAAVPLARHDWHGNYTIHPAPEHTAVADSPTAGTAAHPARPDLTWLRAPALTGLTPPQWDTLIEKLTVTRHAQREAQLHQRCGGARQAAPGTGRKAVLSLDDRLAITLLHLRVRHPPAHPRRAVRRHPANHPQNDQTHQTPTRPGRTPRPPDRHHPRRRPSSQRIRQQHNRTQLNCVLLIGRP